jgi:hypothetical protein
MLNRRAAPRILFLWLGLGLALVAHGCAGGAATGVGGSSLSVADRYETHERPFPVLAAEDEPALNEAFSQAGRAAAVQLRGDGRLAQLARHFSRGCTPVDPALLGRTARRIGLADGALALHCVRAASRAELPGALAAELPEPIRALGATHFGAYVDRAAPAAVVVLSRRALLLEPIPRRVPAGARFAVRGRLFANHEAPRLIVSGPDGEQSFPAGPGPQFDVQPAFARAGCYALELVARAGERRERIALLTVAAGEADPDACEPVHSAEPRAFVRDLALERVIVRRIAELRAAHGLPALVEDAFLAAQASRLDADGAEPEAAGSRLSLARARAADGEALWRALLRDGASRAKLLDPDVTHAGVVVKGGAGELHASVLVAQLARLADVELAPARVLEALNRTRAARGASALRPDATLARIARGAAQAFFEHPERSEHDIVAAANAELERLSLSYRRVAALALLSSDPLEAAGLEPALDADVRAAGIAVASGVRAGRSGGRTLAVVIALGSERHAP